MSNFLLKATTPLLVLIMTICLSAMTPDEALAGKGAAIADLIQKLTEKFSKNSDEVGNAGGRQTAAREGARSIDAEQENVEMAPEEVIDSGIQEAWLQCSLAADDARSERSLESFEYFLSVREELSESELDRRHAADQIRRAEDYCRQQTACSNLVKEADLPEYEWLIWSYEECFVETLRE